MPKTLTPRRLVAAEKGACPMLFEWREGECVRWATEDLECRDCWIWDQCRSNGSNLKEWAETHGQDHVVEGLDDILGV